MSIRTVAQRLQYPDEFAFDLGGMTRYHWMTAALAAVTGAVHVYLYATQGFLPFLFAGVMFYAAILGMLVVPYGHLARRVIYALGIPFTAGQIVGWYVLDGQLTMLAIGDKTVQVALILFLVYLIAMETRRSRPR